MRKFCLTTAITLIMTGHAHAQAVFPFRSTGNITPSESVFSGLHHSDQGRIRTPDDQPDLSVASPKDYDTIILPNLRKILLAQASVQGEKTEDAPFSDRQLRALTKEFVGHPLSRRTLDVIVQRINTACRMSDTPFAYAYAAPQIIHDGVLTITLQVYRIGHVTVSGNKWFSSNLLRYESGLKPGLSPSLNALDTDLSWMNRSPFHSSEIILSPGDETGQTNADIYVSDRFPLYAFAGANNQNDPTLGRNDWFVGSSWGNVLNLDQIITYQYTAATTGNFFNHAGAWQIPLGPRDSMVIYGNYAKAHPFAPPGANYESYGGGSSVSVRWMHMLQHLKIGHSLGINGTVQFGYDWKTSTSNQMQGTVPLMTGTADTNQFLFIYDGSIQDAWGKTSVNNQMVYGPGGMTRRNTPQDYNTISLGASPDYFYDRLTVSRSIPFGPAGTLNLRAVHQEANKNLLYSEQLMLGGIGTIRGYYQNTSFGSRGTILSAQFTSPNFSISHFTNLPGLNDQTTASIFWDYGNNEQIHQVVQGIHSVTLASVGASLDSKINHWMSGTLDVGWRLRKAHATGSRGAVVEYNMVAGF